MILFAMVCFGLSVSAQQCSCVTASLKGSDWSPNCSTNYLELKNTCNVNVVVTVEYYDTSRNKWIKETAYVYGNSTYGICFNGNQYRIINQNEG